MTNTFSTPSTAVRACALVLAVHAAVLLLAAPASAQVQKTGKTLPLALAQEIAQEAVRSCEAHGYRVSASVVDTSGVERVYLRGDHSTIHTRETAFKKAYTIATLGPIFAASTTGTLAERINKTPTGPVIANVTNILLLAGGVAINSGDETIAAVGVGGAPGGSLDEACATAGVAHAQEKLNNLR